MSSDLGPCDHCDEPAIVIVNGGRGCQEHLDEAMRPLGELTRTVRALAAGLSDPASAGL